MAIGEASSPHKSRRLVLAVWLSIAAAVVVIGASFIFLPHGLVSFKTYEQYQGTLVVYADTEWEAPTGEKVYGLVSYDPASGEVGYLIPPNSNYSSVVQPAAFSRDRAIAVRTATTTDLVIFDLKTQTAEEIHSLDPGTGTFGESVWSADGTRIAYVLYGTEGNSSLQATGDQVADDLGFGIPLAFSPSADEVLIDLRVALTSVDIRTGERTDFTGALFNAPGEVVHAVPSGNYLISVLPGEDIARVFSLDWNTHTIAPAGAFSIEEGSDFVFTTNDQVLVTGRPARAYQLSADGRHALIGFYNFKLPEHVHIISWNAP